MNCRDVDRIWLEGAASRASTEAEDHISGCRWCQEFVDALQRSGAADQPSPATLWAIERTIVADLRPVRPAGSGSYVFGVLVAIFASVLTIAVYRLSCFAIALMSPLQTAVIYGVLAISAGLLAYSLVQQMIPGSRHRIRPRLLPVGIMAALVVAIAVLFQFRQEHGFWTKSWGCLRVGIPVGAVAAAAFWLVLRRGFILSPAMTGGTTGLLAGLVGTCALEIHCPNLDASHILVSHLGVAVLGASVGWLGGLLAEIVGSARARNQSRDARTWV